MDHRARVLKISQRLGQPGLTEALAALPTADLTALQLATAAGRAARRAPSDVLAAWTRDRYVAPVDVDVRALRRRELEALEAADAFEAVELSPLAPLGACSTFSAGSQNRVLGAARNLEVLADPTNALALECAARLRRSAEPLRLCTVARVVRCQPLQDPAHTRHFSLFAAVSTARHHDSRAFAAQHLREHVELQRKLHTVLLAGTDGAPATRLEVHAGSAYEAVAGELAEAFEALIPARAVLPLEGAYYAGLRFKLYARLGELELPISDGGLFDWLRTLCSDRKQHLVTSAVGVELVARLADGRVSMA